MPNYSRTNFVFEGDKDTIDEIEKSIKESGYYWGNWKIPTILQRYQYNVEIVENDEWREYAKEVRRLRINAKNSEPGTLQMAKMKRSVRDRLIAKFGVCTSRDWIYEYVGTKWNMDETERDPVRTEVSNDTGRKSIEYEFETAWSGPLPWFLSVCEKYRLDGWYTDAEPGNDFFIKVVVAEGKPRIFVQDKFVSDAHVETAGIYNVLSMYYGEDVLEELDDSDASFLLTRLKEKKSELIRYFRETGKLESFEFFRNYKKEKNGEKRKNPPGNRNMPNLR